MLNFFKTIAIAATFGLIAPIAAAVPVLVNYDSIAPATLETFESYSSPQSFGSTETFNGFTASVSGSLNPDLRIPGNLANFCGSASDKCLISQDTDGTRLFDALAPGTQSIGFDITKIRPFDVFRITVTGNSGVSVFQNDFVGKLAFSDPTGLISVGFENLGFQSGRGNYGFDDVITGVVPAPAGLALILSAFGMFGLLRRKG